MLVLQKGAYVSKLRPYIEQSLNDNLHRVVFDHRVTIAAATRERQMAVKD
jgi:hypothetical protein